MTNKLKCPICGEILQKYGEIDPDTGTSIVLGANCRKCGIGNSDIKLWQALIQSQQDLEESQQATLENAQTVLEIHKDLDFVIKMLGQIAELALAHDDISIADEVVGVFDALKQQDLAYKIREQIDHIADASKMVEHKE